MHLNLGCGLTEALTDVSERAAGAQRSIVRVPVSLRLEEKFFLKMDSRADFV